LQSSNRAALTSRVNFSGIVASEYREALGVGVSKETGGNFADLFIDLKNAVIALPKLRDLLQKLGE